MGQATNWQCWQRAAKVGDAIETSERLSRVVFRESESGGVLQDSSGENFAFKNKNDLVMSVVSSPAAAS